MPMQVEIQETYWTVCWKWIFPYPCRHTRTVKKWEYQFSYLFVSERIFYDDYRGCEFNIQYKWTNWHWWPGQYNDWIFYFVTKYYSTQRPANGPCVPTGQNEDVILLKSPLTKFIDERISGSNWRDSSKGG